MGYGDPDWDPNDPTYPYQPPTYTGTIPTRHGKPTKDPGVPTGPGVPTTLPGGGTTVDPSIPPIISLPPTPNPTDAPIDVSGFQPPLGSLTPALVNLTFANPDKAALGLVYGIRRVPAVVFYSYTIEPSYARFAIEVCVGPIQSVNYVYINGCDVSINPKITYTSKLGAYDQTVDGWLSGSGFDNRLPGVVYLDMMITAPYGGTWQDSVPGFLTGNLNFDVEVEVSGCPVYDPRTTSTVFSENVALAIRDFLTDTVHGCGIPTSLIDDATTFSGFQNAANICDQALSVGVRYKVGALLNSASTGQDYLNALLFACGGSLAMRKGLYGLIVDAPISGSVLDFNDLTNCWDVAAQPVASSDLPTRVVIEFKNAAKLYTLDTVTVENPSIAASGTEIREARYQTVAVTSETQCHRLATQIINRARLIRWTLTSSFSGILVNRGDYCTLTTSDGLAAQPCVIQDYTRLQTGEYQFTLLQYSDDTYSDTVIATDTPPWTDLGDPFATQRVRFPSSAVSISSDSVLQGTVSWTPPLNLRTELFGASHWSQTGGASWDASKINDGDDTTAGIVRSGTDLFVVTFDAGPGATRRFVAMRLAGCSGAAGVGGVSAGAIEYSDDGMAWTAVSGLVTEAIDPAFFVSGEQHLVYYEWTDAGAHRYWRVHSSAGTVIADVLTWKELQFLSWDGNTHPALGNVEIWDYSHNPAAPTFIGAVPLTAGGPFDISACLQTLPVVNVTGLVAGFVAWMNLGLRTTRQDGTPQPEPTLLAVSQSLTYPIPPDVSDTVEADVEVITETTITETTITSYGGLTYSLPDYPFAKQLRVRCIAATLSATRDAATWSSMADSEQIIPLSGNLAPPATLMFAAMIPGFIVGTEVITVNSLNEIISDVVSRKFTRIIVCLENHGGSLSTGVTLDAAAVMSGGPLSPVGVPALVKPLTFVEDTLPALSGAGKAVIAMDSSGHAMKMSVDGGAYAPIGSGGGSGTVTSVAASVPTDILDITGTPITAAGTLAISKKVQNANKVWAGPTTGADAVPTFRALVADDFPTTTRRENLSGTFDGAHNSFTMLYPLGAADIVFVDGLPDLDATAVSLTLTTSVYPSHSVVVWHFAALSGLGAGTVSSVGVSMPAEFSVASSPVTSAGTIAVTKATQNPNIVYAGPASGGAAAPTFRSLVAADVPISGAGSGGTFLNVLHETVFSAYAPYTWSDGGNTAVNGLTWTANDAGIGGGDIVRLDSNGLYIKKATNTFQSLYTGAGSLTSIIGEQRFRRGSFGIWVRVLSYNYANAPTYGGACAGAQIGKPYAYSGSHWNTSDEIDVAGVYQCRNYFNAPNTSAGGISQMKVWGATTPVYNCVGATDDVWLLYHRNQYDVDIYTGTFGADWPLMSAMTFVGAIRKLVLNSTYNMRVASQNSPLADWNLMFTFTNAGYPASYPWEITFDRFRITSWD